MVLVDMNEDLKKEVEEAIKMHNIDYPTIKNFVEKSVRRELERLKKKQEKITININEEENQQ